MAIAWPRIDVSQALLLAVAVHFLFVGQPADGRGIEQDLGTLQRHQPRRFGKPLVPADAHAQAAKSRRETAKPQIAGREVELLVIERIVGNVHLAIDPQLRTIGVKDGRRVVVQPGRPAFEQRTDDHDLVLGRRLLQACDVAPGIGSASQKRS